MQPGGSMPHLQGLSNNTYPEPNNPIPASIPISSRFILILSSYLRLGLSRVFFFPFLQAYQLKILKPSYLLEFWLHVLSMIFRSSWGKTTQTLCKKSTWPEIESKPLAWDTPLTIKSRRRNFRSPNNDHGTGTTKQVDAIEQFVFIDYGWFCDVINVFRWCCNWMIQPEVEKPLINGQIKGITTMLCLETVIPAERINWKTLHHYIMESVCFFLHYWINETPLVIRCSAFVNKLNKFYQNHFLSRGTKIWFILYYNINCGLGLERGTPSLVRTIG